MPLDPVKLASFLGASVQVGTSATLNEHSVVINPDDLGPGANSNEDSFAAGLIQSMANARPAGTSDETGTEYQLNAFIGWWAERGNERANTRVNPTDNASVVHDVYPWTFYVALANPNRQRNLDLNQVA